MKKLITYLLLGVYLHAAFAAYMPVVSYVINYDFYKNVLCENKAKPELQCNGKCHLAKEIKAAKQQDGNSKLPIPGIDSSKRLISVIEKTFSYHIPVLNTEIVHHFGAVTNVAKTVYLNIIVPPPIDIT